MNCKEELLKIFNECIDETIKNNDFDDNDKLDLEILKESMIVQMNKEIVSEKDQKFTLDNLNLYKKFFITLLNPDKGEKEMKLVVLELLKSKNKS